MSIHWLKVKLHGAWQILAGPVGPDQWEKALQRTPVSSPAFDATAAATAIAQPHWSFDRQKAVFLVSGKTLNVGGKKLVVFGLSDRPFFFFSPIVFCRTGKFELDGEGMNQQSLS